MDAWSPLGRGGCESNLDQLNQRATSKVLQKHLFKDQVVFLAVNVDDKFEGEYEKSIKYLDVNARINLLNRRLEVLKDLNSILMDGKSIQFAFGFYLH